ncbi:MAG: carbohydrate-binding family 9-like protein, partial [Nitrospirota bacterium]
MEHNETHGYRYIVRFAQQRPALDSQWDSPEWEQAGVLDVNQFRPESSDHRPRTQARLLYDAFGLYGIFRVEDRYVRCVHTRYMDQVYKDSCVEFFVHPYLEKGYFNFEFNCGGALLCSYIEDSTRTPDGFKRFTRLPEEDGRQVALYHSMTSVVDPEITEPTEWRVAFFIPFNLLEKYVGLVLPVSGREWRANFYKCGDATSHPHWASWAPVEALNFHLPHCFGTICFE